MLHAPTYRSRTAIARLAKLAGVGLLGLNMLVVGGCGEDDPADVALRSAGERLAVLSAGGQALPALADQREKGYREVLTLVGKVGEPAHASQQAAASLITARANLGLAGLAADVAAEHERRSLNVVQQIRSLGRTYAAQTASAAAAEQFNPAEAIAKQTKAHADAKSKAASQQAELTRMQGEVKQMRDQAGALAKQASAKRDEASSIRAGAQGQSQVAQLAAVERAAAVSRESSRLETQASMILAEVGAREPLVTAQQSALGATQEEARRLEAGIAELNTRSQVAKELAQTARAAAAEASAGIARLIAEVDTMRSGDLNAKTEAALSAFQAAASAARKTPAGADKDDQGTLKLALAQALLGRAQTMLIRARGVGALADVLAPMRDFKPAMAEQSAVDAALTKFQTEAKAKLEEAKAALKEAAEAFNGAGGPGVRDRVGYISALLTYVETGDFAAPLPVMSGGAAATTAAAAPAGAPASADVESAVRAAYGELAKAFEKGDAGALRAMFDATTDEQRALLDMLVAVGPPAMKLDKACKAKFGKSLAEIGGASVPGANSARELPTEAQLAGATVTVISPTEARVSVKPDDPDPTGFRLVDGKWKATVPPAPPGGAAQIAAAGPMMSKLGELFNQLAEDIQDGRIATAEQFQATMKTKLQGLMQSMMGGPGGG